MIAQRSKYARDLNIWTVLGQLRDEVVREIAQRLRAGQSYDDISAQVGIGKKTGRRKCAEIAAAMGMQPERSQYERDVEKVRRRVDAGESNSEIAAAMGRSRDSVAQIRRNLGAGCYTQLRFTADEEAEIKRRLLAGESTRQVARAVGCDQADVGRRLKRIAHLIPPDLAPCECGKRRNHGGRCNLVVDPALIRRRLLDGRTASDIAEEFDRTPQNFKPKYVQPVIDQLTAEGRFCGCGEPYGHRFPCSGIRQRQRPLVGGTRQGGSQRQGGGKRAPLTKLSSEQCGEVKRKYRARQSIRAISRETDIPFSTVQRLVKKLREESHYEAAPCPCGRPAWHDGTCWANSTGRVGKRHLARIEQGMAAGKTSHQLADQLGLSVGTVLKHSVPIRDRLFEQGMRCACGRPLNHNHWCSARWDAHEMPRGRRPLPEPRETQAFEALLRGDPVAEIVKAVGTSPDSIWRMRRSLSEDQRTQRAKAIRGRLARGRRLDGEALMARIAGEVSTRMDGVLRDDIISEIYTAVIEGRVEEAQLADVVRSFVSRGFAEWRSAYGPRSLSERLTEDGTATLADLVGDTTALAGIEDIMIGGGRP